MFRSSSEIDVFFARKVVGILGSNVLGEASVSEKNCIQYLGSNMLGELQDMVSEQSIGNGKNMYASVSEKN